MPRHLTYQLEFDSSGSACIRFFGPIAQVDIHYANAKVSMYRMLCLKPIKHQGYKCALCETKVPTSPRMMVIGWDCNNKRWCCYMASAPTFTEIFNQAKAAGVSAEQMKAGEGPDVHLQRIGSKTDVVIDVDSIGKPRGFNDDIWRPAKVKSWNKDLWNKDSEAKDFNHPDIDDVVEETVKNSHWLSYNSVEQLEKQYPKDGSAPKGQVPLYSYGQSQIIYGGPNFYQPMGTSGWASVQGVQGTITGGVVSGTVGTTFLYGGGAQQQAPAPSGYIPEPPAKEPEATKLKPKPKDGEEPPKMKTAEDRWDFLG